MGSAKVKLTLAAHHRTITSGRADGQGKVALTAHASALAEPSVELSVGGQAVALAESVRATLKAARGAETEDARRAETLLPTLSGGGTGGHLELAHVPLKGAPRDALEAAVRRAGARPSEGPPESVHLSRFEIAATPSAPAAAADAMAALRFLDLIFDDKDRFIAATLSGPRAPGAWGSEATPSDGALIEALRLRYGLPRMKSGASADRGRATWTFADGVEIAYVPGGAAGKPAKIVVLDVAAQRALDTGDAQPTSVEGGGD